MKRRSFLHGLATVTTASVFAPRCLGAASAKPKIKLGLDNYAVRAMAGTNN